MEMQKRVFKIHIGKVPKFITKERLEEEFKVVAGSVSNIKLSKSKGNSLFCFATMTLEDEEAYQNLLSKKKFRLGIREDEFDHWFKHLKNKFPGYKIEPLDGISGTQMVNHYFYELLISQFLSKGQIRKRAQELIQRRLYIDGLDLYDLNHVEGEEYYSSFERLRQRLKKQFENFGEISDVFLKQIHHTVTIICYVTFETTEAYQNCFSSMEQTEDLNLKKFKFEGKILSAKDKAESKFEKFAFGGQKANPSQNNGKRGKKKPRRGKKHTKYEPKLGNFFSSQGQNYPRRRRRGARGRGRGRGGHPDNRTDFKKKRNYRQRGSHNPQNYQQVDFYPQQEFSSRPRSYFGSYFAQDPQQMNIASRPVPVHRSRGGQSFGMQGPGFNRAQASQQNFYQGYQSHASGKNEEFFQYEEIEDQGYAKSGYFGKNMRYNLEK